MWLQDQSEGVQDHPHTLAQLNWILRDCALPSTWPCLWLRLASAQHSSYWQSYVIFTKSPTGFLPQDCEPGLWGEKGNRCRIDYSPQPPTHTHTPHTLLPYNDPPKLSHVEPFSHHTHVFLESRFTPAQPTSASCDQSESGTGCISHLFVNEEFHKKDNSSALNYWFESV